MSVPVRYAVGTPHPVDVQLARGRALAAPRDADPTTVSHYYADDETTTACGFAGSTCGCVSGRDSNLPRCPRCLDNIAAQHDYDTRLARFA